MASTFATAIGSPTRAGAATGIANCFGAVIASRCTNAKKSL
jgi:hypothetical protein